ncbi:T9SS type A sorting domain-containing protein [Winogradskyella psychrotolerans]|uniref:T9SS type A sorting domain-containing protein n=1 Tax=Winogradskyella psychrotolerans TaxID=1344585 RepID=UPI001C079B02|nr:T9SS type A sorting domain-containing protein [Winogradskyella psychrotolerans]MBU2927317.1 T9SS type A sorting domain-containing protein [Winogradskyella psychrotolerans]
MKKKLLCFAILANSIISYGTTENFHSIKSSNHLAVTPDSQTYVPDDNFEQALIDLGYDNVLDDYVLTASIDTVTSLDVSDLSISDLTGIEDFSALETLLASTNALTSIDISNNLALVELALSYNQLSSLDISNNTALTSLFINDNLLTTIDVSNNAALTRFGIMRNQFTSIDVSALVNIEELFLHENEISSVTFPTTSPLWKLYIYDNALTELDVSPLTSLVDLRAYTNQLTELDVSMLSTLTNFSANDNQLTSLNMANGNNSNFNYYNSYDNPDLSCILVDDAAYSIANWTLVDSTSSFSENCEQMTYVPDDNFEQALIDLGYDDVLDDYVLTASIDTVTSLNVEGLGISDLTGIEDFRTLTVLLAGYNSLTSIDVSNNLALVELGLSENQLSTLDLSTNTALTSLFANDNLLTTLDVSNNIALTRFGIMRNQLTSIDVSALVNIEELFLHQNYMSSVTFPSSAPLWKLHIYDNFLSTLNVSQFTDLIVLKAYQNQITDLDLSTLVNLEELLINDNQISDITFTSSPISLIYIYNNALTELDLSPLTSLVELRAYQNQLVSLDVSMLPLLTNFSVNYNALTILNMANGNNSNFEYYNSSDNEYLSCIQVDDATYSTANWTLVDDASSFSEDCEYLSLDDNINSTTFSMYPNPADNYITIETHQDIAKYTITNITGQIVYQDHFTSNRIEVSQLKTGIYFILFESDQSIITKKLIIK